MASEEFQIETGGVLRVASFEELSAFELATALAIDPGFDPSIHGGQWLRLQTLESRISPSHADGLAELELTAILNAYEALCSARDRGLRIGRGSNFELRGGDIRSRAKSYRGYLLRAVVLGHPDPKVQSLEAEMYYFPTDKKRNGGNPVKRVLSVPRLVYTTAQE